MSVLSKASCNAGTCHGNINGKGGFFQSLRGQDPAFDYSQWVDAEAGRRINRIEPEKSLALLKATGKLAHEGGKRFDEDSPEYEYLKRWIAEGLAGPDPQAPTVTRLDVTPADTVIWLPAKQLALNVIAHFSDGTERDVTRLAVYESSDPLIRISSNGIVAFDDPGMVTILVRYLNGQFPVRVACRGEAEKFTWNGPTPENVIDRVVFERLQHLKINPAPLSNDSTFIRRLSLDLLGVLPTADEAKAFVADPSEQKRDRLIDDYLNRPEFAAMWAMKWSDLIRNEEKTLDATGVERLHGWMVDQFMVDLPLNEFARQLISARGSTYEHPPANYWRAHREPFVRAETTAQVFLGIRLQCAKCHNHPFDRWSQDEYYQWASVFTGIEYDMPDNKRKDKLDSHEFIGEQIVRLAKSEDVKNERTGKPASPQFLGSSGQVDSKDKVEGERLDKLAEWMTSPDNSLFAEAQTNRIWFHLMGHGLVDPVDDLRATNPASHPELLKQLTEAFVASDYSVKQLVRTIVSSRTYQLSSELDDSQFRDTERYDERLYARAVVRRLNAEQLLDAQSHVLGLPATFEGYSVGTRAGELAGVERVRRKLSDNDAFLRQFGKPERLLACECERSNEPTLGQALSLIGGESLNARLRAPDNRLGRMLSEGRSLSEIVDTLFWAALSRPPSDEELQGVVTWVERTGDMRSILEDTTWALLNSKELIFRN